MSLTPSFVAASNANARTPDLDAAVKDRDPIALAALTRSESGDRARLARGVLATLRRDDREAITELREAAASDALDAGQRRDAWNMLAWIFMRQTRFADALAAFEGARRFGPDPDQTTEAFMIQNLALAQALSGVAPMQADVSPRGETEITRDGAQLARASAIINGHVQEALLDTASGFSVVTQSAAERLGLRFLDAQASVVCAASAAVSMHLALADTLVLAGGRFRNVVFFVVPDAALSFANTDAIIGLSVLLRFGRLEFVRGGTREFFRHRASRRCCSADANLFLDGPLPIALVRADGASAPLRMVLDTGAELTALTARAVREFPRLIEGAVRQTHTISGVGEAITDANALLIPRLTLAIGATSVCLSNIRALNDISCLRHLRHFRHGIIGQDFLRLTGGYAIDFDEMRFEMLRDNRKSHRGEIER